MKNKQTNLRSALCTFLKEVFFITKYVHSLLIDVKFISRDCHIVLAHVRMLGLSSIKEFGIGKLYVLSVMRQLDVNWGHLNKTELNISTNDFWIHY